MRKLSEKDRRFFGQVSEAAFANPFSKQREELDAQLAEVAADDPWVLERAAERLSARITGLSSDGPVRLDQFQGEDRELLFSGLLFHVFHRYLTEIDALIAQEERDTNAPRVRFAKGLLSELVRHGFSAQESTRMLELFYQIRRAHAALRDSLIGSAPSMRRVREELWNSLFTRDIRRYERFLWSRMEDFSTLLVGETGSGKGQAAQALGRSAFIPYDDKRECFRERVRELYVPVHLSEFPESLIESELFGHKKGAFTGAIDHHEGVLARAKPHGLVFLDEIGEVSLPVQVKLLRVLQERVFTPVGGREPQRFLGRVVAATHRSFIELRREGRMRDDFFYRLCTNVIELPSLRVRIAENPDELPRLVNHLVMRILGEASTELSSEVLNVLRRDLGAAHHYAGNVRELEQCVRRVLLTGSCALNETRAAPATALVLESDTPSAEQLIARYCADLHRKTGSYVEVARITGLDRRTVKKHVDNALNGPPA
jgi:sigma-54 specific flagellar transcriptional regulator A